MEKIMILSTASEIAEGLEIFWEQRQKRIAEVPFDQDKMTVDEACQYVNVSYPTFSKWIKKGKVKIHGTGRTRFILKSELIYSMKNNE